MHLMNTKKKRLILLCICAIVVVLLIVIISMYQNRQYTMTPVSDVVSTHFVRTANAETTDLLHQYAPDISDLGPTLGYKNTEEMKANFFSDLFVVRSVLGHSDWIKKLVSHKWNMMVDGKMSILFFLEQGNTLYVAEFWFDKETGTYDEGRRYCSLVHFDKDKFFNQTYAGGREYLNWAMAAKRWFTMRTIDDNPVLLGSGYVPNFEGSNNTVVDRVYRAYPYKEDFYAKVKDWCLKN